MFDEIGQRASAEDYRLVLLFGMEHAYEKANEYIRNVHIFEDMGVEINATIALDRAVWYVSIINKLGR